MKRSPVVDAVADAPHSMAEMFVEQYPLLPDYNPLNETTAKDLMDATGYKRVRTENSLIDKGWIKRKVRLPSGRRAWAWRPK
jgi:hypothetical protein